jgi:hypothetical protein
LSYRREEGVASSHKGAGVGNVICVAKAIFGAFRFTGSRLKQVAIETLMIYVGLMIFGCLVALAQKADSRRYDPSADKSLGERCVFWHLIGYNVSQINF